MVAIRPSLVPLPLIQLKKRPPALPDDDSPLEWLVTNGLSGYASGSVAGPPLRRFHGLLIAAHPAPAGRLLLLHHLDETLRVDGQDDVMPRPGASPGPTAQLADFYLQAGLPHWLFTHEGVEIERAVFIPHEANTVHVRYRLSGAASQVRFSVRPWLDFPPHEGMLTPRQPHRYTTTAGAPATCEFVREGRIDDLVPLRLISGKRRCLIAHAHPE